MIRRRPPRKLDVALVRDNVRPLARKLPSHPPHPPDVLARRIDELDLQRVRRRLAPHAKRKPIVVRQIDIHLPPRRRPSAMPAKIEIHPHRAAVFDEVQRHAIGRSGGPLRDIVEIVDDARRGGGGEEEDEDGEPQAHERRSLTNAVILSRRSRGARSATADGRRTPILLTRDGRRRVRASTQGVLRPSSGVRLRAPTPPAAQDDRRNPPPAAPYTHSTFVPTRRSFT